jgi:hypothetical protein
VLGPRIFLEILPCLLPSLETTELNLPEVFFLNVYPQLVLLGVLLLQFLHPSFLTVLVAQSAQRKHVIIPESLGCGPIRGD